MTPFQLTALALAARGVETASMGKSRRRSADHIGDLFQIASAAKRFTG